MNKVKAICSECGAECEKTKAEFNRNKKSGRRNFCSRSCAAIKRNKELPKSERKNFIKNLFLYRDNRRDEYTPFRFFMKVVNNRNRHKSVDIDLSYLKDLWERQNGICYFTGWHLILPQNIEGWRDCADCIKSKRASLDRIDNSKGYVKGNVRFISFMANIARSNMSDEELIKFCKSVTENQR